MLFVQVPYSLVPLYRRPNTTLREQIVQTIQERAPRIIESTLRAIVEEEVETYMDGIDVTDFVDIDTAIDEALDDVID